MMGLKISTPGGITGTSRSTTLDGHSLALLDKVRSFDNLPRLGALTTLNLSGNDLKVRDPTFVEQGNANSFI